MKVEVDALAAKGDPFQFQTRALFVGCFVLQPDEAALAKDAVPGQTVACLGEDPGH
jgi:hypothetical protein